MKIDANLIVYNVNKKSPFKNLESHLKLKVIDHNKCDVQLFTQINAVITDEKPIIILDAKANLPKFWSQRLIKVIQDGNVQLCSALTCQVFELSPLKQGQKFSGSLGQFDNVIYLLQNPAYFYTNQINKQCFVVKNKDVLNSMDEHHRVACNNLLVQSGATRIIKPTNIIDIGNQNPLPAHALAQLHWKLQNKTTKPLSKLTTKPQYPLLDGKPVTLHITMNWGGGVQRWVNDYCHNDTSNHHIILVSTGEFFRYRHGEIFQLNYQQTDGILIDGFDLHSPINATQLTHPEYLRHLNQIITQYQVQKIMVSSLIGHSMDCLNTGIQTIKVMHDYFPSWPSLVVNLDKEKIDKRDLISSLKQTKNEPFGEISLKNYQQWVDKLHQFYQLKSVHLVAPSLSVKQNLLKIDKRIYQKVEVIPHAIKVFQAIKYTKKHKDFTVLVLGRINPSKGQNLLGKIIYKLPSGYQFILLGAGKQGEKFSHLPQVKVIADYDNEKLGSLLQDIQADIALITSQTSETFNYTLSELQQAGVCTVSSKFGALKDRIIEGKTGFLCDNVSDVFIKTIQDLNTNPELILNVREQLKNINLPDFSEQIDAYHQLIPKIKIPDYQLSTQPKDTIFAQYLLDVQDKNNNLQKYLTEIEKTLKDRTQWTSTLNKNLEVLVDEKERLVNSIKEYEITIKERSNWAKKLNKELKESGKQKQTLIKAIKKAETTIKERSNWGKRLTIELEQALAEKKLLNENAQKAENELNERTKWAEKLDKNLQKAQKQIKLEQNESKHLKEVISQETTRLEKEIESIKSTLQSETSRMTSEIQRLNQDFEKLNNLREKLEKELLLEHAQLLASQRNINEIKQTLEETIKQKQSLENNLSQEQAAHQFTQQQLTQTQNELNAVYMSRSWRMTKPVRKFTTWARHKRNAAKFRYSQAKALPTRVVRSLKSRGFIGTLGIVNNKLNKKHPQTNDKAAIENPSATSNKDFPHLVINESAHPTISIIIPVYNHFEHTYNCLKSIAELKDTTGFEVIVVDDCSTDQTQELIKNISGITYQRQDENGGFIESCNTGAKLAQGKYLMFLNNDTVVYNNWLDSLIDVFQHSPDAGLVGSKLVYPNNQLQEAGGIVFSDASGWNYGRLGNPDEPEFNHIREVDYCSGASILIERELFKSLGYFDERYKPAYYEDTDLAFAVRNIGKKVYYQPESKITHFEGISSGTDLSAGMKKFQVVNQVKFKEKWEKALKSQMKSGSDIELCRIHNQPKRILIFDACTPMPDQDSGSLRMINIIKILKQLKYHVIFMPENLSYVPNYTFDLQQLGVECIFTPYINNPVDFLKDKGKYLDVVILSRYYVAEPVMPFIREYCPIAKIIFDTVDLHYVRERRMAELEKDNKLAKIAEQTRKKELAVAQACDTTLVVSPYEVEVLAKEIPEKSVKVLTNIHAIYGCRKPFSQRKDILFIGGYQHTPNVDAVIWFVDKILPAILEEIPELKFHIIGSKAPKNIQQMASKSIIFHGFVEDIEPFMDDIRIAVAPLRYGAGVKGKVNMSMSYGQPVVGTKVAVEGMFTIDEKDCLMAEKPDEFAKQVVRLYGDEDLWNTISKGGLDNVQNYFSFEAAKKAIKAIL